MATKEFNMDLGWRFKLDDEKCEYIFGKYTDLPEGELTKIRANSVCEGALFEYALEIRLGDYIFLGNGEEKSGGRNHKAILADAFEAVLAAIYLDGGYGKVERVSLEDIFGY